MDYKIQFGLKSCIYDIFFMLVSVGLLMDDLKFVGAVILLSVLIHSLYTLFIVVRKGGKDDKTT